MAPRASERPRIGIDTGGTFTDLVSCHRGEERVVKVPSTPDDPARAVVSALAAAGDEDARARVVHGTTVALNALLTGRVAPTALVTGRGFADLLEIGRQDRPDIYALHPEKPRELVPRRRRFELSQRSWPDPADPERLIEVERPTKAELARLATRLKKSGAKSAAICLLHSWSDPEIEGRVLEALSGCGLSLTASARLHPEYREVERFSTAVVNACLVPLMRDYLGGLEARLEGRELHLLQSNGGTLAAARAAEEPVRVVLSGPAGGVVGAARAAAEAGLGDLVTLDMGGTSTDVAFHSTGGEEHGAPVGAGDPPRVAGHPIAVPSLDIHTIGCGGGSLVRVDAAGALHVGPQSAGAVPGPVCYGSSEEPTVTDAHVFLGHIAPGRFLADGLDLDRDAVARAFEALGKELGVPPVRAAAGVLEVARAAMRRAVAVMTLQRGEDPRRLPLVAFGGAGGLHAAALATSLSMPRALVPALPGALSAWGMARAEGLREKGRTILAPLAGWKAKRRRRVLSELAREADRELVGEGFARRSLTHAHFLDLRYRGQSFELRLAEGRDPEAAFHRAHERLYGYALPDRPIELVALRTRARAPEPPVQSAQPRRRRAPARVRVGERPVHFGRWGRVPIVERLRLAPGHVVPGPAVLEEYSGTTLVPPGWEAYVTAGSHLLLRAT